MKSRQETQLLPFSHVGTTHWSDEAVSQSWLGCFPAFDSEWGLESGSTPIVSSVGHCQTCHCWWLWQGDRVGGVQTASLMARAYLLIHSMHFTTGQKLPIAFRLEKQHSSMGSGKLCLNFIAATKIKPCEWLDSQAGVNHPALHWTKWESGEAPRRRWAEPGEDIGCCQVIKRRKATEEIYLSIHICRQ